MTPFLWASFLVVFAWASLTAAETWYLRNMERGCTRYVCLYRFLFQVDPQAGEEDKGEYENFNSAKCGDWKDNEVVEKYVISGKIDPDTEDVTIRIKDLDRNLFVDFCFTGDQWNYMEIPSGFPMSQFGRRSEDAAERPTIIEDPAPEVENRMEGEVWTLGDIRHTHKRAINRLRSDDEHQNIVDAPQWTVDSLTREFIYDEENPVQNGLWKVEIDFNILSTTTDGTTDERPESVWLRKCADIDFFMSWGYIGHEDSAVMTLMYINPDKGGKSRIGWTSFQRVNDRTSFDRTDPFPIEDYVCESDAWPCNTQS